LRDKIEDIPKRMVGSPSSVISEEKQNVSGFIRRLSDCHFV
jgi:hypothetical protein